MIYNQFNISLFPGSCEIYLYEKQSQQKEVKEPGVCQSALPLMGLTHTGFKSAPVRSVGHSQASETLETICIFVKC